VRAAGNEDREADGRLFSAFDRGGLAQLFTSLGGEVLLSEAAREAATDGALWNNLEKFIIIFSKNEFTSTVVYL